MMKLRDTARKTQAEIKKEDEVNSEQRFKLKALRKQLEQARKATDDALGVSEDAKATHAQADDDETASGSAADALAVEDAPARKSLSFLEIRRAATADEDDDYGSDNAAPTQSKPAAQSKLVAPAAVLGKHTDAKSLAPISMWKEDHGDISGELRRQSAVAQHSDGKRQLSKKSLGEPSEAMSRAPISMWKEDHGDQAVMVASQSLQDGPAAALGKPSGVKSQPVKSLPAGKTVLKKAVAAVAGNHPNAKSQPTKRSQAGNLAKDAKALAAKPSSAMRKIISGPPAHQKAVQVAEPSHAASRAAKVTLAAPVQETNALNSNAEEDAADEKQLIEVAGDAAETDKARENLAPSADEQLQVLHEGASSSEGMVASLSQGVKRIQVEVQRSEAQLKLHFQKAYKAGKKRHAALIKQSEALDKNLHSMQLQEKKLETTLAKDRETEQTLKHKIQAIVGILNRAVSPITSKQIV
jgi:hypothetical protein